MRKRLLRKRKTPLFRREPGSTADDLAPVSDAVSEGGKSARRTAGMVIGGVIALGVVWLLGAVFLTSPTLNTRDARLVFAPRSPGSWKQERSENWTTNRFCELGFEIHERPKLFSPKPKIVFYGDSYIEAAMIPGKDRMQNRFRHDTREALGIGYSGIGAAEYCFLMRRIPAVLENVGWHVVFVGDIYDFQGVDPRACSANLPGALPTAASSSGDRVSARYRLFAFRALMRHWRKTRIDWRGNHWRKKTAAPREEKSDLSAVCLELKSAAEGSGGRLLIVYAPLSPRIHRGQVVFTAPDTAFGRELASCCRKHNIGLIDLGPDFAAYFRRSGKFPRGFFNTPPGEGHLNVAGHAIAAAALSRYFREVR